MPKIGNKNDNNSSVPTLAEYITQQIAAKRVAALDKSRNRTSVRVPMVLNDEPEELWKRTIDDIIRMDEELLSRMVNELGKSSNPYDISRIEKTQKRLDKLLEEKDRGYPKLVPGANCMYNAGDCYGLNIPGNQTFVAKHKEIGFKKAPKGSMEPGDIVQDVRGGIPIHAMIYDSKDAEGNLLFNYARGNVYSDFENSYVKQGKYSLPIKDYDVYKYVGTPADSTQWINEYKQKYGNGMRCGGRRKAQLGLDIREGGIAIPIANNMWYIHGRKHEDGGVTMGPNNKNGVEVEGGEVVKVGKNDVKVFSSVPLLRGVSPAQLVMGGANPNKVFNAQEEFKDRNRINDDGTTYQNGGQKKSNSAIRTEADKKVPAYNRAVYSLVDPTMGYPTKKEAVGYAIGAGIKAMRNPNDMVYWVTDSVSDAAWRKRHGLSYDNKFLIPNEDGSVRLPKDREMEIPTDTTMLKNRIAANKKLAKRYPEGSEKRDIVDWALRVDGMALDSLRHTYKTGEPVTINEGAYNSRRLINNGELNYPEIMPHNVMQNYAIQYDKSKDKMNYWDTYNFNEFEWGVPGKPFEIRGSIPLKRYGGSTKDDTKTAALKRLRNKFTIRGNYNGGMFGGVGAGSVIIKQPEFVTDTITKRYLVPVTQNFNDAFGDAVNAGLDKFMFDKKWYTTKKGNNPNNNAAGAARTQTVYLPVEHKEVRRREKEFGGNMIYEINGNIKNGLMSLRPKAQYGKEKKINNDIKIGDDNLIYKRGIDGNWYTDGTTYEKSKYYMREKPVLSGGKRSDGTVVKPKTKSQSLPELVVTGQKPTKTIHNVDGTFDNARPQFYAEKRIGLYGDKSLAEKFGLARSGWSFGENPKFNYVSNINIGIPNNYKTKVSSDSTYDVSQLGSLKSKAAKAKLNAPSTGGGTQAKDGRWVGQYKATNAGDWIGLGSNVLGSLASYFITKNAINKMPDPVKPVMAQAAKLKTRYNIEPQLTNVREAEQMNRASVRRNTASSNTSLAREQRLVNESRGTRNQLYGQKENIETQLINQDRLNRQSVRMNNVRTYNDYLNRLIATRQTQNQLGISNINNLIYGLTGSVNNILGNIESRKATNNTIRAIAAANPNVDARLIGGFDYYIDPITKKKYNKNQQYVGTING